MHEVLQKTMKCLRDYTKNNETEVQSFQSWQSRWDYSLDGQYTYSIFRFVVKLCCGL